MSKGQTHSRAGRAITACLDCDVPELRSAATTYLFSLFRAKAGNLQAVSRDLGVPVRTVFRWVADHRDVETARESARTP